MARRNLLYRIIIFKNGKRVNQLKTYRTYKNALIGYNRLLRENKVFFPKKILWDGTEANYELALTAPKTNKGKEYYRNELGTLIRIIPNGDFTIKKISPYYFEDCFKHKLTNKIFYFKDLIKFFMEKSDLTIVVYAINNKLVVGYFENDEMDVFTLKNQQAVSDLISLIKTYNISCGFTNFMYFDDPDLETKKQIYDHLEKKYNIDRKYMIRQATR